MKSKLAVIIPIYNTVKYLRVCIDSVINQSYEALEIILVDDGSTDGSSEICDEYEKMYSKVKAFHQTNKGSVEARKAGLFQTDAEYIGFVDSDDWIERDMYENLMNIVDKFNPDLITSAIKYNNLDEGKVFSLGDSYKEGFYENIKKDIYPSMLWDFTRDDMGILPFLMTKVFKRQVLLEVCNTIDPTVFYSEDVLTLFGYCMRINNIYITQRAYYNYRVHRASISFSDRYSLLENSLKVYKGLLAEFQGTECEWVLVRQLRRHITDHNAHVLRRLFDTNPDIYFRWEFSCEELLESRLVLYGAGVCGQAFYHYALKKGKQDNIIAWIDQDGELKNHECLHKIGRPEEISSLEYEHIVIAVKDSGVKDSIVTMLTEQYNVDKKCICWENGKSKNEAL